LSFRLLSKILKVYKGVTPLFYKGEKLGVSPLQEEHKLRVLQKSTLRRISEPIRKWQDVGEKCIMKSFKTCAHHEILSGQSKQGGWEFM
jgi:hypothetical protein